MTTAQIIYEQYKVLPKRVQKELKSLIINAEEAPFSLIADIGQGLNEVKQIRNGELPRRTFDDLKREMRDAK